MGQNAESTSSLAGVVNPALIIAIGGLFAYFSIEPALESRRPNLPIGKIVPGPPTPKEVPAVHARLWDDPLAAALADSKRREESRKSIEGMLQSVLVPPVQPSDQMAQSIAEDMYTIVKDRAAGVTSDGMKEKRFLCMPVFVPGGPFDSDTEKRKRITYAVLSGLTACGYELGSTDRVTYVELDVTVTAPVTKKHVRVDRFVVPIKVFQRSRVSHQQLGCGDDSGPEGALVVWINEDQLGCEPINVLGQILQSLFPEENPHDVTLSREQLAALKRKIEIGIIGPSDSLTLLDMAQEHTDAVQDYLEGFHEPRTLFSSSATISSQVLVQSVKCKLDDFVNSSSNPCKLKVVRSIGSDTQLVRQIVHELGLRGAWPFQTATLTNGTDDFRHHIALVTESDTAYGLGIPVLLRKEMHKSLPPGSNQEAADKRLHVFTYLRGLDGKIPGEKTDSFTDKDKSDSHKNETDPLLAKDPDSIPANGRSQFDYLRRLESNLARIDEEAQRNGDVGISAIGVLGTDIYDKLIVLRALRKRFPKAWFFSTDVDASFSLPSEYPSTRNLLIASHFGLTLHPDLQRRSLPFRDSYQTSTYFATLLALHDPHAVESISLPLERCSPSSDPWGLLDEREIPSNPSAIRPLMFEIGKSGPYQLTIPSQPEPRSRSVSVHAAGPRVRHWLTSGTNGRDLALLWALVALCSWWFFSDIFNKLANGLFAFVGEIDVFEIWLLIFAGGGGLLGLLLSVALHDHGAGDGEPFVLFEGISIWPPIFLRACTFLFSLALIAKTIHDVFADSEERLQELLKSPSAIKFDPGEVHQFTKLISTLVVRIYTRSAIVFAIAALFLSYLICGLTEIPSAPFRGWASYRWSIAIITCAAFAFCYLTGVVLLHLEHCRRQLRGLDKNTALVQWILSIVAKYGQHQSSIVEESEFADVIKVRAMAIYTNIVGKMVGYPFIVILIILCSRHPSFDKLDLTWSLILIWGLIAAAVAWKAHLMRQVAHDVRKKILDRLRQSLLQATDQYALVAVVPVEDRQRRSLRLVHLRRFIDEVEKEDRGAFRPLIEDPFIRSLAFAASGSLMFLHQFFQ